MQEIHERLSAVEKSHEYIEEDIKEIKGDVKAIATSLAELPAILKEATETRKETRDTAQRIWTAIEKLEAKTRWVPIYDKLLWGLISTIGTSVGFGIGWLVYNAIIHWGK